MSENNSDQVWKSREKVNYRDTFSKKIKENGFNTTIYRFTKLDHILHLLKTSELIVSQVKSWEDPFENFLLKTNHDFGSVSVSFADSLPSFYGQCWTLLKESDALWRIYSSDKRAVRLKSRINLLGKASLNEINFKPLSTIIRTIGPVEYQSQQQIEAWIRRQDIFDNRGNPFLKSLFIKRREFSHEKEVRLIIQKGIEEGETYSSSIRLAINPNELIEEITFDPRIEPPAFETYSEVLKKMGFQNKISKSRLYEFTPNEVK
ncbi:MAG: hypothetical protein WA004_00540 [Saprospiraceae bacterium]